MMFVEVFVTKGTFSAEQRERVARRLGTIEEMGDESDGEAMAAESAAVYGSMFQVVVHEPEVWVVSERVRAPQDPPRCVVRMWVPGSWRMSVSDTMISYATRIVAEEFADARPYTEPTVQVHVVGITEGSIGMMGRAVTSEGLVEMMSKPYEQAEQEGKALRDPLCGVLVPLDDNAVTLELEDELYAFCCKGCRSAFIQKKRKEGIEVPEPA